MRSRYERFNEITFISYCMVAVNRAIKHGLHEKAVRSVHETSLSEIEGLDEFLHVQEEQEKEVDTVETVFTVDGFLIPVKNTSLAAALRSLTPQRRNILLLAYLIGLSDAEIAREMRLSRSNVQYLRSKALKRIKDMMRNRP